jgi:hypothetical protein
MRKKTTIDTPASDAEKRGAENGLYRDLRWDKLDNTAHLFPVIAGEQMSNVYRISVTLTELIVPELLQKALDIVLPKFDGFNVRLRCGIFWYYFEENGKRAPVVEEESAYPCQFIRANRNSSYLFRISYYKYRINLEVFHVLTDGMGAVNFLRELTYQYLRLLHPELKASDSFDSDTSLCREDSFLKNYRRSSGKHYRTQRALHIKGERFHNGELGVIHGYMKSAELKQVSRSYGASINEYLVSAYIWSIYTEYLNRQPVSTPIRVAVPVNLRPYFDSITTKNFFVMVSAEFLPDREDYTFQELLDSVKEHLRSQMNREHLERVFSYSVSYQRNPLMRLMPLPVKKLAMRTVYARSARANTATISNMGIMEVSDTYRPYIEQFHVLIALSKGQHVRGTVCSYDDTLVFSFSHDLVDVSVQRGFFRRLTADGIQVEIESNGVNYG